MAGMLEFSVPRERMIFWHQLYNESPSEREMRLSKEIHRIFFDNKEVCPAECVWEYSGERFICEMCRADVSGGQPHNTPPFLPSLDAMQLVVECGKFAEVREDYTHWLSIEQKYTCRILLYRDGNKPVYFEKRGTSRQNAFYQAALIAMGYEPIGEGDCV